MPLATLPPSPAPGPGGRPSRLRTVTRHATPAQAFSNALLALATLLHLHGCTRIPEPESAGGRLYAKRCAAVCHGAYRPHTMKLEMWKIVVKRMQSEMARRGVQPLDENELAILFDYLERHSG